MKNPDYSTVRVYSDELGPTYKFRRRGLCITDIVSAALEFFCQKSEEEIIEAVWDFRQRKDASRFK